MKKIILEEKIHQKLAVFSLELFSPSTLWSWNLHSGLCNLDVHFITLPAMWIYPCLQIFGNVRKRYPVFSKEHIFYLLISLLNLIQPGTEYNLPFTSRWTICRMEVPENKGRKLTYPFQHPTIKWQQCRRNFNQMWRGVGFQPKPCRNSSNSQSGSCQKGDGNLHRNRMVEQKLHQSMRKRKI